MRLLLLFLFGSAALASVGCSRHTNVTLGRLVESQQEYAGQRVQTRGVVRSERNFDGSSYFVLSDPNSLIVGLEPAKTAAPFQGRSVRVSGLFEIKAGFGRVIHIDVIAPADAHTGARSPTG